MPVSSPSVLTVCILPATTRSPAGSRVRPGRPACSQGGASCFSGPRCAPSQPHCLPPRRGRPSGMATTGPLVTAVPVSNGGVNREPRRGGAAGGHRRRRRPPWSRTAPSGLPGAATWTAATTRRSRSPDEMFYPQTDVRFVYGGRLRGVRAPREDVRDGHHVVEVDLGGAERAARRAERDRRGAAGLCGAQPGVRAAPLTGSITVCILIRGAPA